MAFEKAVRQKLVWPIVQPRIAVRAVNVVQKQITVAEAMTPPLEGLLEDAAYEGEERIEPADFLDETAGEGLVFRELHPVLGVLGESIDGKCHEAGYGDDRPHDVDEFDGADVGRKQMAFLVPVPGNRGQGTVGRRLNEAGTGPVHFPAHDPLGLQAAGPGPPVRRADRSGFVDHCPYLPDQSVEIASVQFETCPTNRDPAEDSTEFFMQTNAAAELPAQGRAMELTGRPSAQLLGPLRSEKVKEQRLTVPVSTAVEHRDAAFVLKKSQGRIGQGATPGHPPRSIKHLRGLGAYHAISLATEEARLEDVAAEALASTR